VCAGPGKQVNFDETPRAAELKRRDPARSGQGAQRDGVQAKRRCGLGYSQQFLTHIYLPNTQSIRVATGTAPSAAEDLRDHSDCDLLTEATVVHLSVKRTLLAKPVPLLILIP
jgi:hypothetical protein